MAHPAIAWQADLGILQKWHNDFPNKLAGCQILLNISTETTYTSMYVIMYQTKEFRIKDKNENFEVEGNDK